MPTVASILRRPDLTAWAETIVTFRAALDTAYVSADLVRTIDIRVTTDTAGYFNLTLAPGYYWVWIGALKPFVILVPTASGTYLLKDLLSPGGSGAVTDVYEIGDNYLIVSSQTLQLLNATTGTWHPVWFSTATGDNAFAIGASGSVDVANYRITSDSLQIYHADDEAWHAITINSSLQLVQAEADTVVADNYRIRDRMLQILNQDTADWHTIYLWGALDAPQLAIGPATT